jgi:TolA-binding protein
MSGLGLTALSLGAASVLAKHAYRLFSLRPAFLGLVRVAGVGVVSSLAVWAGVSLWSRSAPTSALPANARQTALNLAPPPAIATIERPEPAPAESEPAASDAAEKPSAARARPTRAPAAATGDSLADELEALEPARRALSQGDSASALKLLDDYARRFPRRRLDAEASVLRLEALVAHGDKRAAQRLGQEFLAKHPQGPYARRVRSLIGENAAAKARDP